MQTHLVVSNNFETIINRKIIALEETMTDQIRAKIKSHMPKDSLFFERIVPVSLITMGIITLGLIFFAAGVILGIIQY